MQTQTDADGNYIFAVFAGGDYEVTPTAPAGYRVAPQSREVDVTSYVQAERAAGRSVISLLVKNPTATSTTSIFNSREAASHRPQLVVTP